MASVGAASTLQGMPADRVGGCVGPGELCRSRVRGEWLRRLRVSRPCGLAGRSAPGWQRIPTHLPLRGRGEPRTTVRRGRGNQSPNGRATPGDTARGKRVHLMQVFPAPLALALPPRTVYCAVRGTTTGGNRREVEA